MIEKKTYEEIVVRGKRERLENMSLLTETRELLEIQLGELEAMQSVYPDELEIVDHGNIADINEFVAGDRDDLPQRLEYSIVINTPEGSAKLHVNLPPDYPQKSPEVYASSSLDRTEQNLLNEALAKFIEIQETGEPCIYSLVVWLEQNLRIHFQKLKQKLNKKRSSLDGGKKEGAQRDTTFGRYWVYSHHIYSNAKRKSILEKARESNLTGFSLPGKPGIICIEGAMDDCEYWWQKIKVMNWHKILVKLIENENSCNGNYDDLRKFKGFQEIGFPSTDTHNDMGQLFKYLTQHESQHVFKELFGVEGKTT